MHLIESGIPFSEFVVMMQKEVADRISAQPNTKAYGSLSIAVQYYMTAKVAFIVPRNGLCASAKCGLSHFKNGAPSRACCNSKR